MVSIQPALESIKFCSLKNDYHASKYSLCVSLIILMRHSDYKNIKEFPRNNIPLAHVSRNVRRTVWKVCSLMIRLKGITKIVVGKRNGSFFIPFSRPSVPIPPPTSWKLKILLYPEYMALAAQTNATFLHSLHNLTSHAIFVIHCTIPEDGRAEQRGEGGEIILKI